MRFFELLEGYRELLERIHVLSDRLKRADFEFPKRKTEIFQLIVGAHGHLSSIHAMLVSIYITEGAKPKLTLINGDKA